MLQIDFEACGSCPLQNQSSLVVWATPQIKHVSKLAFKLIVRDLSSGQ